MAHRSPIRAATDRNQSPPDFNRRQALNAAGKFALCITPARIVLRNGTPAQARLKTGYRDSAGQNRSPTP